MAYKGGLELAKNRHLTDVTAILGQTLATAFIKHP
jgi:hypothetical protein